MKYENINTEEVAIVGYNKIISHNSKLTYLSLSSRNIETTNSFIISMKDNSTLKHLVIHNKFTDPIHTAYNVKTHDFRNAIMNGLMYNFSVLNVDLLFGCNMTYRPYIPIIQQYMERNRALQWPIASKRIIEITLGLYELPPYVILEIIDWSPICHVITNPIVRNTNEEYVSIDYEQQLYTDVGDFNRSHYHHINHYKKIKLIESVISSIRQIKNSKAIIAEKVRKLE